MHAQSGMVFAFYFFMPTSFCCSIPDRWTGMTLSIKYNIKYSKNTEKNYSKQTEAAASTTDSSVVIIFWTTPISHPQTQLKPTSNFLQPYTKQQSFWLLFNISLFSILFLVFFLFLLFPIFFFHYFTFPTFTNIPAHPCEVLCLPKQTLFTNIPGPGQECCSTISSHMYILHKLQKNYNLWHNYKGKCLAHKPIKIVWFV